jgi:heat shock protein HslJ
MVLFNLALLASTGARAGAAETPPLAGTAWVLAELPGRSLPSGAAPTLRFERDHVKGEDGCGRFTAPYTAQGGTLEVILGGPSAMMDCPAERTELAHVFLTALEGARTYKIEGGWLQLVAMGGDVLATLAPQAARFAPKGGALAPKGATLAGTAWRATAVADGKQAVTLVADSSVTLEFETGGRARGSAGCNDYTAGYRAEGSRLTFQGAAATRKMCARPEVMEQELRFLKTLETVAGARVEGDTLELRTAAGAVAVSLTRAAR